MVRPETAAWDHLSSFRHHQKRGVVPVNIVRDMQLIQAVADDVIRTIVVDMRREGATWVEVGEALNVSAQAAHHRYRTVTK